MNAPLDLNRIELFREVVLSGSFSKAAARLQMPKSRVSRHIAELERSLGLQLIYRTTRQFRLTQIGMDLFQKTAPILSELKITLDQVSSEAEEVAGLIKVTVPEDIGSALMGKICHDFMILYPKVEIYLHASNQVVDLVKESIDVALRIGPTSDSSLIRRKVGQVGMILVASPGLLARNKGVNCLEEISHLPFLSFSPSGQRRHSLRMTNGRETRSLRLESKFSSNNFFVLRSLAMEGDGFASIPAFLVAEELASGSLVHLFKEWEVENDPVQILVPAQREIPHKIRAFVNFLAQHLRPSL